MTSWVHVIEQVSTALEEDAHFFALADEKWCLAIHQPLRWGFAGTSKIAEDFIEALSLVPGAELMSCAARNKDRLPQAQEFAKKHGEYRFWLYALQCSACPAVRARHAAVRCTNHTALGCNNHTLAALTTCRKPQLKVHR